MISGQGSAISALKSLFIPTSSGLPDPSLLFSCSCRNSGCGCLHSHPSHNFPLPVSALCRFCCYRSHRLFCSVSPHPASHCAEQLHFSPDKAYVIPVHRRHLPLPVCIQSRPNFHPDRRTTGQQQCRDKNKSVFHHYSVYYQLVKNA